MKDIDKKFFSDLIDRQHKENIALINLHINRIDDKIQINNESHLSMINERIEDANESAKSAIQKTICTAITAEIKRQNESERTRLDDIFVKIGIDITKPLEAQALAQHLRDSKKRADTIKDMAFKKALMILLNAVFFIFMLGAGTYFIDKKIEIALAPRDQKQEILIKKNNPPGGA